MMHLMIDLETTSTAKDAGILSIGIAVVDGLEMKLISDHYYANVQLTPGNDKIDPDTFMWWLGQSEEARNALVNKSRLPPEVMLDDVSRFIKQYPEKRVWGNAASFDLGILESCYKRFNRLVPWHYREEMCYRTLKNIFPNIAATKPKVAHNALADATAQAEHLAQILQHIRT